MTNKAHILGIVTAVLMLGAAVPSAQALDVSVGGVSVGGGSGDGGGTSVSVGGGGDTSATATIGGGSNVANATVGTGGNTVNANIGNTPGDLVTANQNGGTTQANVNLGGLGLGNGANNTLNGVTDPLGNTLGGIDVGGLLGGLPGGGGAGGGGGGGGGGTITAGQVAGAYGALAPADQRQLRVRCNAVLASPGSFNTNVVTLCRVIARL